MIKAITTTLNGNVKQRCYVMNDDVIHTECKCGEELYYADHTCDEHEHWWCPSCETSYVVPYEIIRSFDKKQEET